MAPETSKFESTEMLATFLGSTPLLEESWQLCSHANANAQQSFAVKVVAQVGYVAFSGVQVVACSDESCRNLVELDHKGIFGSVSSFCVEGNEEAVMVHGGLLQIFISFYHNHNFQQKIAEILSECKSIIFTGHSLGGAIASLSALWLLSYTQHTSPSIPILCITYGSPLLGNKSFNQAILQERWAGNFVHIVAQHDLVPRMLFAPASPFVSQLSALFTFWHLSMTSPYFEHLAPHLSDEDKNKLFEKVLACAGARLGLGLGLGTVGDDDEKEEEEEGRAYWPFGSYMFCTEKGAICLDNGVAIVKFLYLTMAEGSANSCIRDHLMYEDYVGKARWKYLQKRSFAEDLSFSKSSSEAGIQLALHSSGISSEEPVYGTAMDCLATARQLGWRRNLNNAKMAISLSKINPFRAEIEWYKTRCEENNQLGYYDSFKCRGASRREFKVNMNRLRLARFWDDIIEKLETNHLTHDFHKLTKYVYASQFYKLLVEPLEIAEYYRTCKHLEKGHYIEHGREKRFRVFDKWWGDRNDVGDEENEPRRTFASLTQDSCFWARVEEARDLILRVTAGKMDNGGRLVIMLEKIEEFEQYACGMVERKEVSVDVLAKNSSYSLFREEWRELKSQLQLVPPRFHGY